MRVKRVQYECIIKQFINLKMYDRFRFRGHDKYNVD